MFFLTHKGIWLKSWRSFFKSWRCFPERWRSFPWSFILRGKKHKGIFPFLWCLFSGRWFLWGNRTWSECGILHYVAGLFRCLHCHSLQFGYKFLHYIAGFFSLFSLFWNPENSGFFLFSIALGWFCLSVIGCFPYFFLVFSGSLCYSIYNNVYRILYPDLKLKKMHCLTHCLTTYFNQSVKKVRKKVRMILAEPEKVRTFATAFERERR